MSMLCCIASYIELMEELKLVASAAIEANATELHALSVQIWKNPELNYEEYKAHDLLTNYLEKKGFFIERSYTNIETAFKATFGSGGPNVGIICEYDALPEMGHACGHNLIAEAGVAAGIAVKTSLEAVPDFKGTVTVLGTPAEEGGGGKVLMMKNGAFEAIDLVMMVHPGPSAVVRPLFSAVKELHVKYKGRAAHAAAYPWEGVNALDAAVMAYNSIGVLRQQVKPSWRVHLVILEGGIKPNIIPETSVLSCYIKAPNTEELCILEGKVSGCFKSASVSTGCQVEIKQMNYVHCDIQHNVILAEKFAHNYRNLGAEFVDKTEMYGSTDMVKVSGVVPTLYAYFAVGSGQVNHSMAFAEVSNTAEARASALLAGKAMAHTCLDVLTTEGLLDEIKQSFEQQTQYL